MSRNNPGYGKLPQYLSLGMAGVFLGLGCFFLLTDVWIDEYPRPFRNYIGYLLLGWAIFRLFTVWTKIRQIKRDEEDENE